MISLCDGFPEFSVVTGLITEVFLMVFFICNGV